MFALRFALLFVTWCAFSGLYDPYHLGLGVLSSLWVAAVSSQIALTEAPDRPQGSVGLVFGLLGYVVWLLIQVLKANVQVLKLSFSADLDANLTPEIVEFRTSLADDFSRFLLAHSITLTPGTVTVRVDGDWFVVHALTQEMAAAVPGEMETRLLALFPCEEIIDEDEAIVEPESTPEPESEAESEQEESDD